MPPLGCGGTRRLLANPSPRCVIGGCSGFPDPGLVTGVVVAQKLPWLFVGLPAAVVVDRVDPRRLAAVANTIRATVIAVLVLFVHDVLGRGPLVFGGLLTVGALGGLVASAIAERLLSGLQMAGVMAGAVCPQR